MEDITVGFIGFGLIGGSIAKAIKEKHPGFTLIAYDHHTDSVNVNLSLALQDGTLSKITHSLEEDFSLCDLILLCGPVLHNINYLSRLKSIIKPASIITDVGSVKGAMHDAVKKLGLTRHFIGGHPMAGSEKTGYENASAHLLENAYYILTPTEDTTEEQLSFLKELVTCTTAIPVIMDSQKHDDMTAAISHVPHVISASLVNMVQSKDLDGTMKSLAAGGFKDITRISSSSPEMWLSICLSNRDSILKFIHTFQDLLKEFELALTANEQDAVIDFFRQAKEYRDSVPTRSNGVISRVYEVYMDLLDETGAIATVATILASNAISIKNIGIIHNREFEEGVLRIELYEEAAMNQAIALLRQYHYTIYER
ncbi:prephenate dehydrogenase [[Clostridium] polysaccharolyticum]|uniref:Prephenate dehydrogenase n=1 Tax=[Clostridium] polysaccharolyticum TaxID=29364 RepID=A0A1H9Y074_9FIRM|nr:prephenate dehydrogenase [[Clostridium] polysaccharolyticum]SES62017.1 prephenate dehydrogenase [[Clostridium] polysaccharolyticum]